MVQFINAGSSGRAHRTSWTQPRKITRAHELSTASEPLQCARTWTDRNLSGIEEVIGSPWAGGIAAHREGRSILRIVRIGRQQHRGLVDGRATSTPRNQR